MLGKTNIIIGMPKRVIGKSFLYEFTGNVQEFIAPYSGIYELECAGAGSTGNGSTVKARVKLRKKDKLYISVGGSNGWNGGGSSASDQASRVFATTSINCSDDGNCHVGGGSTTVRTSATAICGGGATDISTTENHNDRFLVAGGGGGGGTNTSAYNSENSNGVYYNGTNGSTRLGAFHENRGTIGCSHGGVWHDCSLGGYADASYGYGGGGGGYYGGTSGYAGTSYINDNAAYKGRLLNISNTFINTCNHAGNGYAKITCIK